jgi:hypothetical protein
LSVDVTDALPAVSDFYTTSPTSVGQASKEKLSGVYTGDNAVHIETYRRFPIEVASPSNLMRVNQPLARDFIFFVNLLSK